MTEFVTLDSGARKEYPSGMLRDSNEGKPRFDLMIPLGVPFNEQFLTRVAMLLARGAVKYGDRNWEKATELEEQERAQESAIRHLMQWLAGETDEDHAAAVVFNLMEAETIRWKRGVMAIQDCINQTEDRLATCGPRRYLRTLQDLDELPIGTVVQNSAGEVFRKRWDTKPWLWQEDGDMGICMSNYILEAGYPAWVVSMP